MQFIDDYYSDDGEFEFGISNPDSPCFPDYDAFVDFVDDYDDL